MKLRKTKEEYSLTNDSITDVTFKQTTSLLRIKNYSGIDGTSFACPRVLIQDLKVKKK